MTTWIPGGWTDALAERVLAVVGGARPQAAVAAREQVPPRPAAELVAALRTAESVLAADRVLADEITPDWTGILRAHRAEPLGRVARRALAGRADCPAELLVALAAGPAQPSARGPDRETFDAVATRGIAPGSPRRTGPGRYPPALVSAALAHIGQVRPLYFWEAVASGEVSADRLIAATGRFDLLVRALGRCMSNQPQVHDAFWPAIGRRLRPVLGRSPARWLAAAAYLPAHRGTVRGFLRDVTGAAPRPEDVNLHLLCQAPDRVIAAVVDGWDDADLMRAVPPGAYPYCGTRERMVRHALRGGAAPRHGFGWWRRGADDDSMALWPVIGGAIAEGDILLRAEKDVALRRAIVWSRPPDRWGYEPRPETPPAWDGRRPPPLADRDPATDLIAELRASPSTLAAEAVLSATLPDDAAPDWPAILAAHQTEPLPPAVIRALVDRPKFPAALFAGLTDHHLTDLFTEHPGAVRLAMRRLPWHRYGDWGWLVPAISGGVVAADDVLTLAWPARNVLLWMVPEHVLPVPDADRHPRAYIHHTRTALARTVLIAALTQRVAANPVDATALRDLLPGYDGPVAGLLREAAPSV